MNGFLLVAVGGAIGASARHGVNLAALRLMGEAAPWGTLAVNVIGGFLMGLVMGVLAMRGDTDPATRLFLATGVLGGFTTFSAFSLDVVKLSESGAMLGAVVYVGASVILSVVMLLLGLALARAVFS